MIIDNHSTLIHTDNDLAMFGDLLNNLSLNSLLWQRRQTHMVLLKRRTEVRKCHEVFYALICFCTRIPKVTLFVFRMRCGTLNSNQSKVCECVLEFPLIYFNILT